MTWFFFTYRVDARCDLERFQLNVFLNFGQRIAQLRLLLTPGWEGGDRRLNGPGKRETYAIIEKLCPILWKPYRLIQSRQRRERVLPPGPDHHFLPRAGG